MLVVNRFVLPDVDQENFAARARDALAVLAARPGYRRGVLCRAYDDPGSWNLVTEWESVGAYRRALSAYDVKVIANPVLAQSLDEPSAFEELAVAGPGGDVLTLASDRAPEPPAALRSPS